MARFGAGLLVREDGAESAAIVVASDRLGDEPAAAVLPRADCAESAGAPAFPSEPPITRIFP
jgi:hypothetical protein